jgi:hypothetical protein
LGPWSNKKRAMICGSDNSAQASENYTYPTVDDEPDFNALRQKGNQGVPISTGSPWSWKVKPNSIFANEAAVEVTKFEFDWRKPTG